MLSPELQEIIKKQARAESPKECCGLILNIDNTYHLYPCVNQAKTNHYFIISQEDTDKCKNLGTIIGFYHSHPNGEDFSMVDRVVAEKKNLICILYDCVNDTFRDYQPCGFKANYENRPHVGGILDCITLAQDYYERELNIRIPDFHHPLRCWSSHDFQDKLELAKKFDNHPLRDFYLNNNFIKVTAPQKNDLILCRPFREAKSATATWVFLGDNKVLGYLSGKQSSIELYRVGLKNNTVDIMRHKNYVR